LQIAAMRKHGIDERFIITEKASGKTMRREELQNLIRAAREGDTIVVWKLDRFGRTLVGVIETCELLAKRGINIVSLTEKIDTTSAIGRAFFQIILVIAELERGLISERTTAGIAKRRAEGVRFGKPHLIRDFPKRLERWVRMRDADLLDRMKHKEILAELNAADPKAPKIKSEETYRRWKRQGFPGAPDVAEEPIEVD
jgi:DNA invertase Pin-like site-specific DNA recombinase